MNQPWEKDWGLTKNDGVIKKGIKYPPTAYYMMEVSATGRRRLLPGGAGCCRCSGLLHRESCRW